MLKPRRIILAGLTLSLALGAGGCYLYPAEEEPIAPPLVPAQTVTYDLYEVGLGDIIIKLNEKGAFVSENYADLSFESRGGRVKEVYVRAGSQVQEGDPLVELDSASLIKDIERQEIMVEKQTLTYEQARRSGNAYSRDMAQLDLRLAELTLEDLKEQLEQCILRSPMDGIISFLDPNLIVGETVSAYQQIARIADPDEMLFEYQGAEAYNFKMGAEATIIAEDGTRYDATVAMAPGDAPQELLEAMKNRARLRVEGAEAGVFAFGEQAEVELLLNKREGVAVIPRSLVRTYMGRKYVNILTSEGVREERDIETGLESTTEVEIRKGLEPGDMIIK